MPSLWQLHDVSGERSRKGKRKKGGYKTDPEIHMEQRGESELSGSELIMAGWHSVSQPKNVGL